MKRIILDQADIVGRFVCDRTGGTYSPVDSSAIGLESEGKLIAGVLFDHYNKASIAMHVASDTKHWLTWNFLNCVFSYPFKQLKVKKILGLVDESNHQARKFDEHLGFILETRIKGACVGGDLLIYTMTEQQCKFLGDKHGR